MKRLIFTLTAALLAAAVMGGCAQNPSAETGERLAFPKTEWGMTPQEALEAYDLSFDDVTVSAAPQIFSGAEDAFYAACALECGETREVFGENALLTFYFADMVLGDTPVSTLGLIYAEARFPETALETYNALEEQLDGLAQRDADARIPTSWASAETLSTLDAAEDARQYFDRRSLDAEAELAAPLAELSLFSEIAEGQETPDAILRWYGLNAALAAYLEENEDPVNAFAEG